METKELHAPSKNLSELGFKSRVLDVLIPACTNKNLPLPTLAQVRLIESDLKKSDPGKKAYQEEIKSILDSIPEERDKISSAILQKLSPLAIHELLMYLDSNKLARPDTQINIDRRVLSFARPVLVEVLNGINEKIEDIFESCHAINPPISYQEFLVTLAGTKSEAAAWYILNELSDMTNLKIHMSRFDRSITQQFMLDLAGECGISDERIKRANTPLSNDNN
jgi:hypothetical protein